MAQPYIAQYGYLAVFVVVMVEGFGIIAPGQTILFVAALVAARGDLNIVLVAGLALAAAVAGDNVGYAVGRFGGRQLLLRYGRFVGLRARHIGKIKRFANQYGARILVVARFVDVLRQTAGIGSGLGGLRWRRFALFDAIGCCLWVGAVCAAGFLLGNHIVVIINALKRHPAWLIGAAAVVLLVIATLIVRRVRGNKPRHERRDIS